MLNHRNRDREKIYRKRRRVTRSEWTVLILKCDRETIARQGSAAATQQCEAEYPIYENIKLCTTIIEFNKLCCCL